MPSALIARHRKWWWIALIKGITVTLYAKTQTGVDAFGEPVFTETPVSVPNVLVTPTTNDAIVTDLQLYGKRSVYELCIPKGDAHDWRDVRVSFFGKTFRTFATDVEWIGANTPTKWNRKVKVELIE